MRRPLRSKAALALALGLAACQSPYSTKQQPVPVAIDYGAFRACVDREVPPAVDRETQSKGEKSIYGYQTPMANAIIRICSPQLADETMIDYAITKNPFYLYVNSTIDARFHEFRDKLIREELEARRRQEEADAPRLKAEQEQEDRAGATYYACLVRNVRVLSVHSNEPAEVIAQAAVASCGAERSAMSEALQKHHKLVGPEVMDAVDSKLRSNLLLEVIKVRVLPTAPPSSPTPKAETPI